MATQSKSLLSEFKDFILRGNVVDLAVAVVIGLAFQAVVAALVRDILTPIVAAIFGKPDFAALTFTLHKSHFFYGDFINAVISFVSIALAVFIFVIKPVNYMMNRRRKAEPDAATMSDEAMLLAEIRDLLRQRQA